MRHGVRIGQGRLQSSRDQPPDQSIERKQIRREQGIGNESPQQHANFHHFASDDAVSNDGAKQNDPQRRKPKQSGWFDKVAESH